MENVRGRFDSFGVAGAIALAVVTASALSCSSDPPKGLGAGPRGGSGGATGGGGLGGSIGGLGGSGGGGVAGTGNGGMAMGGAAGTGGQPSCQVPGAPGTWAEIAPPPGQDGIRIRDVFAAGANDLFFAANMSDPTGATPATARVLRWTQGCWTVELSIPPSPVAADFPSVHGTGPNDVWASGGDTLFHRDAQGWTRFTDESWRTTAKQPAFYPAVQMHRLRAAAPNDVWVAATSNIMHWNGQWTTYNFDDPTYPNVSAAIGYYFNDIWIDSPGDVWIGGMSDQVGNTMDLAYMHHFDGATWTHHQVFLFSFESIWRGGSGAPMWLSGVTRDAASSTLTLSQFDGTTSTAVPIAGVDPTVRPVYLTSLFGHAANDIWSAGGDVAHFDGQGWSLVANIPAAARNDQDDHNTYVGGDSGSVWLATPGPHFYRMVVGP